MRKDLSNFPVNNSLILETQPLEFIRPFLGRKKFRDEGIYNNPRVKGKDYLKKFPEAKYFQEESDEFVFFHHERIPSITEIRKVCKNDRISNYLLDKEIEPKKISKVITCYTGACGGNERFEEIYMLSGILYGDMHIQFGNHISSGLHFFVYDFGVNFRSSYFSVSKTF